MSEEHPMASDVDSVTAEARVLSESIIEKNSPDSSSNNNNNNNENNNEDTPVVVTADEDAQPSAEEAPTPPSPTPLEEEEDEDDEEEEEVVDNEDKEKEPEEEEEDIAEKQKDEEETAISDVSEGSDDEAGDATEDYPREIDEEICTGLLSLPLDSLHHIASFLTPKEWSFFGQTCSAAHKISEQVIQRVLLHGFKCAMEVIAAWKMGHHADAKELAALYIKAGVPIYPQCFGHSYRTILWRMKVEAKAAQMMPPPPSNSNNNVTGSNTSSTSASSAAITMDAFYLDRLAFRAGQGYSPELTYAEEKALFWMEREIEQGGSSGGGDGGSSPVRRSSFRNNSNSHGNHGNNNLSLVRIMEEQQAALPNEDETHQSAAKALLPSITIPIHRHLLDQHEQGKYCVDDLDENMSTLPLSLSADFFHPRRTGYHHTRGVGVGGIGGGIGRSNRAAVNSPVRAAASLLGTDNILAFGGGAMGLVDAAVGPGRENANNNINNNNALPFVMANLDEDDNNEEQGDAAAIADNNNALARGNDNDPLPPEQQQGGLVGVGGDETPPQRLLPPSESRLDAVLYNTEFSDVYTAGSLESLLVRSNSNRSVVSASEHSTKTAKSDSQHSQSQSQQPTPQQQGQQPTQPSPLDPISSFSLPPSTTTTLNVVQAHNMRAHFAAYERRLGGYLSRSDYRGFEECLMDFWDEFLTQTAFMHYFDQHTAVPRSSCLAKFLTRPCPKAVGIIQCEIERIKITSKGKGVKGRFFPTYEYRLFVRHHNPREHTDHSTNHEDESTSSNATPFVRKDLLLLVAKHQGRNKHSSSSSSSSSSPSAVEQGGATPKGQKKGASKGANNYCLFLPQQADMDAHFHTVNETTGGNGNSSNSRSSRSNRRLPSSSNSSDPVLMGRLQGNFIGTEFQLFIPRNSENRRAKRSVASSQAIRAPSDDDDGYDSGMSSDNTTSRRSRFSRFLRSTSHSDHERGGPNSGGIASRRSRSAPRSSHSVSAGGGGSNNHTTTAQNEQRRPSRRAIANENQSTSATLPQRGSVVEEEDGVITYTANLLGSRPRIMDVCIPKVSVDGIVGEDWKRHLDECADTSDEMQTMSMLHCFKQLQQRLEALDPQQPRQQGELQQMDDPPHHHHGHPQQQPQPVDGNDASGNSNSANDDFGLLALQNRPPWWNVELGSFVLNFGGRVSVASVKNFQLCDRNNQDDIMLQFGRIQGRHSFTMDFQHPLTAVQAFSIAISSLQSKISFG